MVDDLELRRRVVLALDAVTPPAPWLGTRVRRVATAPRRGRTRLLVALAAAVVVVVVLPAAYLLGATRQEYSPGAADPATAQYVAMVKHNYDAMHAVYYPAARYLPDCVTPAANCLSYYQQLDAAGGRFLSDLQAAHTPSRFTLEDSRLRQDLARGVAQMDAVIVDFAANPLAVEADDNAANATWHEIVNDATDIIYAPG